MIKPCFFIRSNPSLWFAVNECSVLSDVKGIVLLNLHMIEISPLERRGTRYACVAFCFSSC